MRIFKFGGASVKDAASIRNLGSILHGYSGEPLFLVISAMGKVTNLLEHLAHTSFALGGLNESIYGQVKDFHEQIATELMGPVSEGLRDLMDQLAERCTQTGMDFDEYYDQVVPFGELLSTRLISDFLSTQLPVCWLDARELIITDQSFRKAVVDLGKTEGRISGLSLPKGTIPLTQGFIAASTEGKMTTLGREGSDFSAALFGKFLGAEEVIFWKDVPGIMNADPKLFPSAEKFDHLSYQEATEMTFYGAKVIHPKTLKPLSESGIPLRVRSFVDIKRSGTSISGLPGMILPTYVFRYNQTLVTLRNRSGELTNERLLIAILSQLDALEVRLNMTQISALTYSFAMDHDDAMLQDIHRLFEANFEVYHNSGLHLATVKNFDQMSLEKLPGFEAKFLEQITRHNYQRLYLPL